jgi:hypothetical protein
MKKLTLLLALAVFCLPSVSFAASLTSSQVQAILSLLSAFGADSAVIANVNATLTGGHSSVAVSSTSSSNPNSCGGKSYPSCATGSFQCLSNGQPSCGTVGAPVASTPPSQPSNANVIKAINDISSALITAKNAFGYNCNANSSAPQCSQIIDLQALDTTYEPVVAQTLTPLCDLAIGRSLESTLSAKQAYYKASNAINPNASAAYKSSQLNAVVKAMTNAQQTLKSVSAQCSQSPAQQTMQLQLNQLCQQYAAGWNETVKACESQS